jgi:hypothetical protein
MCGVDADGLAVDSPAFHVLAMNRLHAELQRLFLLPSPGPAHAVGPARLLGPGGEVRALVLELARPADWEALSRVWRGVQDELQWPAPAIAASGTDGLQLWFSLQRPVARSRARDGLAWLQSRYLADIEPGRVRTFPTADEPPLHAALVPAQQGATGQWSAFIAPDLAAVFADTPWLDIAPGAEGQADLLARLDSIEPAAFDAVMPPSPAPESPRPDAAPPAQARADALTDTASADVDPRRFLQRVLNDETVELALRIEAAKALLQRP